MRHAPSVIRCLAAAVALATVFLGGCAGPYSIGYACDPLEGPPVKFKTPLLVRQFSDCRPLEERTDTPAAANYSFWSCDKLFRQDVADAITRCFQLELANTGIEVADEANHLIGNKPYIRVTGDLYHFQVTRADLPVSSVQDKVTTLWRNNQYQIRISFRISVIDTASEKVVMRRVYTSNDTFDQRSDMIDVKAYEKDATHDLEKARWKVAGDDYCIQLLNEHLKRTMVQVRKDIVWLLTPAGEATAPKMPALEEPGPEPAPKTEAAPSAVEPGSLLDNAIKLPRKKK